MSTTRKLWLGLGALLLVSFGVLLWMGGEIFRNAPPMPTAVVTTSGQTVFTRDDIETGRQVWQSMGGQQLGSIWGHGALVAPDWSADWLHREAVELLELRARKQSGRAYADLTAVVFAADRRGRMCEVGDGELNRLRFRIQPVMLGSLW